MGEEDQAYTAFPVPAAGGNPGHAAAAAAGSDLKTELELILLSNN